MKKFNQFINENINLDYKFKTIVTDVSVYGLDETFEKQDVDYDVLETIVEWRLQPDVKNDRIKTMDLMVTKIQSEINIDNDNIVLNTDSPEYKEWEIISEIDFQSDGGVCPESVEIDFREKKIKIL